MSNLRRTTWALAAVLALATSGAAAGRLYKWVDEHGVTHYSERMPPKYKDNSSTVLDEQGRVVKKNSAGLTSEQIEAIEKEREERKAQSKELEKQRRRDNALLNTYTTASEIDDARERALAGALQARQAIEARLKSARDKVAHYQGQAAAYEKRGKPVPEGLQEEMDGASRKVDKVAGELKMKDAQIDGLRKKYDNDRQRFIELKEGKS
ncbi:MAG: DUF4124 domain-containing protein [Betaproteobacteria bacterium]|nr:DUF4124 domain-containing protein [Betaproteobacteria bacterium]